MTSATCSNISPNFLSHHAFHICDVLKHFTKFSSLHASKCNISEHYLFNTKQYTYTLFFKLLSNNNSTFLPILHLTILLLPFVIRFISSLTPLHINNCATWCVMSGSSRNFSEQSKTLSSTRIVFIHFCVRRLFHSSTF